MLTGSPSQLHDALAGVLGLEPIEEANERLRQERLQRQKALKESRTTAKALISELTAIDHPRAEAARTALTDSDVGAPGDLLAGESGQDADLDTLCRLAALPRLDLDEVEDAGGELEEAVQLWQQVAGTDADRDRHVAELLERAVILHARHGDADCPVCGRGRLDQAWTKATNERISELRDSASTADAAAQRRQEARERADRMASADVVDLNDPPPDGLDLDNLRRAQSSWSAARVEGPDDADAFREGALSVAQARDEVREAAAARRDALDEAWRPFIPRLASWLDTAEPALAGQQAIDDVGAAETWMKGTIDAVRSE